MLFRSMKRTTDADAEESGSALGEVSHVRGSERESGRVDDRLEEEDDEEGGESSLAAGRASDDGEYAAHGAVDGKEGGRVEIAKERSRGETGNGEGDLHEREHAGSGRGAVVVLLVRVDQGKSRQGSQGSHLVREVVEDERSNSYLCTYGRGERRSGGREKCKNVGASTYPHTSESEGRSVRHK